MEFGEGKIGGKYAVGPKIGSGSFGEVYLVNNFGTEEIYAMKKVSAISFRRTRKQNISSCSLKQKYSKTSRALLAFHGFTGKATNISQISW